IAATIVPVLVGYLMGDVAKATIRDGNPALFIAMGIFALAFIVLSFVSIPEPYVERNELQKSQYGPMSFRHFRLGIIAIFIYVGVEVAIPSIANLYMTQTAEAGGLAMPAAIAGTLCGTYWFLMFVGRLVGGLLGGKVSPKLMLGTVLSIAAVFVLLAMFLPSGITVKMPVFRADISFGLEDVPLPIMFLILCGLCTSVMWGGIFNLAVEGLGKYTAMGSGIFMVMVCGGGILPALQGWIADMTSNYISSYWVVFAGIIYMLFFALVGSRNVNKEIPTE
ncbi:MAG: MFS transporter, partial [Bacteroidales bacterium]|nr:MFS transporter [Bacteroidales bacterium]